MFLRSSNALFIASFQVFCSSAATEPLKTGRIVGGTEVPNDNYPWFARSTTQGVFCGGVLISPEYVLTAAHCTEKESLWSSEGSFEIGALCRGFQVPVNCGQRSEHISSRWAIQHPLYNSETYANDFALVRLDEASTIEPANIDEYGLSNLYEQATESINLWAIGFGFLKYPLGSLPSHLQHVDVAYVPNDTCASQYSFYNFESESMFCAASPGKDACSGDSGGPLFDAQKNVVVGITSWGVGCAQEKFSGVYSRIHTAFDWIKETICSDEEAIKPSFCYCSNTENRLSINVRGTKESNGKLIFKIRNTGSRKIIGRKIFRNRNGRKDFCFDRNVCLNAFVITKSGGGSYNVTLNGREYINDEFNGITLKRSLLPCPTRSSR